MTIEHLRQLHQQAVNGDEQASDELILLLLGGQDHALPHLLDIAEAAQTIDNLSEARLYRARPLNKPGSSFHHLHEALNRLETT